MNRGDQFVIDSIKMDLYRVFHASADLNKPFPTQYVNTFLNNAYQDFEKLKNIGRYGEFQKQIKQLTQKSYSFLEDPRERLRWSEDVLTIRARM